MHRSLWVKVAHSSFIEGSYKTKNTASDYFFNSIPYRPSLAIKPQGRVLQMPLNLYQGSMLKNYVDSKIVFYFLNLSGC
jgi:hypothetical protein